MTALTKSALTLISVSTVSLSTGSLCFAAPEQEIRFPLLAFGVEREMKESGEKCGSASNNAEERKLKNCTGKNRNKKRCGKKSKPVTGKKRDDSGTTNDKRRQ